MTSLACAWAAADGPLVIAHRGASGYLPEHTLEAYAVAHAMGADFIEPDLVLTKDGVFICLHDIHLEPTTDVETKFPDRKRADGHWYPADFTLAEIKQLAAHERLKDRFPQDAPGFQVPTFEEMIRLVQGLNAQTGRNVGIYPELKEPAWHEKAGLPMVKAALDLLAKYGYTEKDSKVFLQCFEAEPLKKARELGAKIPLILLVGNGKEASQDLSEAGLDAIAKYASGIGPDKALVEKNPKLVEWAHARGLAVHPYTFRVDNFNGAMYAAYELEIQKFVNVYKVDGFFTDHPDRGKAAAIAGPIPTRIIHLDPKKGIPQ
jgi:glycerophosphoryl diester phosphodiesterase